MKPLNKMSKKELEIKEAQEAVILALKEINEWAEFLVKAQKRLIKLDKKTSGKPGFKKSR